MMQMNLFKRLHWRTLKKKSKLLVIPMKNRELMVKTLTTLSTGMIKRPQL